MSLSSPPRSSKSSLRARLPRAPRVRVVVIDDHPAIQVALTDTLDGEMDLVLCGCAGNADDAFALVERERPDVAVIDVALRDAHGLDLMQNLRAQHPELQVVIFSMYDEAVYAERALRAGALGYVMKQEPTQRVVEAIRCVAQGEVYLSRRMASRMLSKLALGGSSGPGFAVDELTDREMAVFQMLGQGQSVQEITDRLNLSRKTVETYRRRAKEKLGFDTVGELQQYAIRWRLKYGS